MRSRFAFVAFAFVALAVAGIAQGSPTGLRTVSIVQLLSLPEKFDGKRIAVLGYLTIGQENNHLYLGRADYDNALLPNSIWVDVSDDMVKRRNELNMKYVRMVGVFHVDQEGRGGPTTGRLDQITDCVIISDPDHPLSEKLKGLVRHDPAPDQQKQQ